MSEEPEPLLSISDAARQIGVHKSTLSRQVTSGAVRSHKGKVRLSEVLEDRASNIDLTRSRRRAGDADAFDEAVAPPPPDATLPVDATDDGEPVLVDGAVLPYKEARALKETYLARLRKLEYQREMGELVAVEDVVRIVTRDFSIVRNRLIIIPGKLGYALSAEQVEQVRREIYEALEELSAGPARPEDVVPYLSGNLRRDVSEAA